MKSYKWIIGLLIFIFASQGIAQDVEFSLSEFDFKLPNPQSRPITVILPMISDSGSFYVGTYGEGVFRYSSKGQWIPLNDDLETDSARSVTGLAWLKVKNQAILCLGSKAGLFISSDRGIHWQPLELDYKINCLNAVNNFDSLVFAGTDNGIFEINDSLQIKHIGLENKKVNHIAAAIGKFGVNYLYAIADDTLFQIKGSNKKWEFPCSIRYDALKDTIRIIYVDPDDPDLIYIGTSNRGVFRAEEGGKKILLDRSQSDFNYRCVDALFIDNQIPAKIHAVAYNKKVKKSQIFKTYNYGVDWIEFKYNISDTTLDSIQNFSTLLKLNESSLIVGTREGHLLIIKAHLMSKPRSFWYRHFWEGNRRYYTIGGCGALIGTLISWGICELCCNDSNGAHHGLPDPPDFP